MTTERPPWKADDPEECRFWVDDTPSATMPWFASTVAIVDEDSGGVIVYCHEDNADRVLDGLRRVANVAH